MATPQNHQEDMVVAVGVPSTCPFVVGADGSLDEEDNVKRLEEILLKTMVKMPQSSVQDCFSDCGPEQELQKSLWLGSRKIQFAAAAANDDGHRQRPWTLIVRYKRAKANSHVVPFYVDMRADSKISAHGAIDVRRRFVVELRDVLYCMGMTAWRINPSESLLSPEMKELGLVKGSIQKINGRLGALEKHCDLATSADWSVVGQDEDAFSMPSTNSSFATAQTGKPGYLCCCSDLGPCDPSYGSHSGKKCKDGTYDIRTLCNREHCKQCGGVQKKNATGGYQQADFRITAESYQCCCDGGGSSHPQFRHHKGARCQDGSYDMRFKENRARCKTCGGEEPQSHSMLLTGISYSCCCEDGGSSHPQFRQHTVNRCQDGSYDMRFKENRTQCKSCGGKEVQSQNLSGVSYPCCCDNGGSSHLKFRQHDGHRCQDGSFDMRFKENKTRCKACGGEQAKETFAHTQLPSFVKPGPPTKKGSSDTAPFLGVHTGTQQSACGADKSYSCCCHKGASHRSFRQHQGRQCKDGSYDMRVKENKGRCKQCGGN